MKTKSRLRLWYSGRLCCRIQRKLSTRPRLDLRYLIREPAMNEYIKNCGPEVCFVGWYTWSRVIHNADGFSRLTSPSWSRSQSRSRAGEMPESGWGPAAAAACPWVRGLNLLILKQRWLPSSSPPVWRRRRVRLRQGNTGLIVLLCYFETYFLYKNSTTMWIFVTRFGIQHMKMVLVYATEIQLNKTSCPFFCMPLFMFWRRTLCTWVNSAASLKKGKILYCVLSLWLNSDDSSFCRILSEPQFEWSHCREEQVPHCSLSPDEWEEMWLVSSQKDGWSMLCKNSF